MFNAWQIEWYRKESIRHRRSMVYRRPANLGFAPTSWPTYWRAHGCSRRPEANSRRSGRDIGLSRKT